MSATVVETPQERAFFDLCLAAAARAGRGTVIRVAGGWVRDKLLGMGNDDIDLAVDNVSGVEFANAIKVCPLGAQGDFFEQVD